MKTIALIVHQISGGGAEKVAADLSKYFYQKGYKVIFFVKSIPSQLSYEYAGEVEIIPILGEAYTGNLLSDLKLLHKQIKIIRRKKKEKNIDIAISFVQEYNLINILSRRKEKVIVTLHNVVSKRNDLRRSIAHNKWTYRFIYQLADKIVFVSKYCKKDWISNYGDFLHKSKVIYNPIGKKRISNSPFLSSYGENVVISVARFSPVKRPWHIIRMFSKVLRDIPDAKLLMLGDGELLPVIKKLAKDMGMEKEVIFLGHVDNVDDYLERAKVFVSSSASESFGCSIVEAMNCGIPVVINDCPGGIKEILGMKTKIENKGIVRGKCGTLTFYFDGKKYGAKDKLTLEEMQMAEEVIRILSNKESQKLYFANCKKNAERFQINKIGLIWEKLINGESE